MWEAEISGEMKTVFGRVEKFDSDGLSLHVLSIPLTLAVLDG
jgi:hypothetical protein